MTFEEAQQKAFTIKWKVGTCNQGEDCWCRTIETIMPIFYKPHEKLDEQEYYVLGDAGLGKEMAEYFVQLHNEKIDNL